MERSMHKSKSEMSDSKIGYTDDFYRLDKDFRVHTRFLITFVRMGVLDHRRAQILAGNYSQKRFEDLRRNANF